MDINNSENTIWQDLIIRKEDRVVQNGHKSGLIWLTGLPCSGKTTIAKELQQVLFTIGCRVYVLDGDNIRKGLCNNLGFTKEDRSENLRRVSEVAKLFVDAGFIVIAAFIAPFESERKKIRAKFREGEYVEVFLDASVSVCEKRDVKGMYAKARKGEIKEFTGVSASYDRPSNPEIVIPTSKRTINESIDMIIEHLRNANYFEVN